MSDPIVITGFALTPMGGFQGAFSSVSATDLGAEAVQAAVDRSGADPNAIHRIYMGCVLPAGLGQAPARQAALVARLGCSVEPTTVNKMCGSGMQAVIMAAEALEAGAAGVIVGFFAEETAPIAVKTRAGETVVSEDEQPGQAKSDKMLAKAGWSIEAVDLFEVNEAFAVIPMVVMRDLAVPETRMNVCGEATALGHPRGASGARILATLIAALKRLGLSRGVAALCISGGEAAAIAIEVDPA